MKTDCTARQLEIHTVGHREVAGRFDEGRITWGGDLLLREVDARIGLMVGLAGCFVDYRNPA